MYRCCQHLMCLNTYEDAVAVVVADDENRCWLYNDAVVAADDGCF